MATSTPSMTTTKSKETPQWMKDVGTVLGLLIVPPIVIPVLLAVAFFGMLVFLPFLPPLLAEFMAGSTTDPEKKREKKSHRMVVPLSGHLHGHHPAHW